MIYKKSHTFLFIANWKMSFDFNQSIGFVTKSYEKLIKLTDNKNNTIVLCPSMPAVHPLIAQLKDTNVHTGAQDCSNEKQGAFTGQVSAQHLKTAGATYCIIGHSERRQYNHETDEQVGQKCLRLLEQEITPIICIGENHEQCKAGKAFAILEEQLKPIFETINHNKERAQKVSICIAYEPIWAIGTGIVPQKDDLDKIFSWLHKKTKEFNNFIDWKLLYGGSVQSSNAALLRKINHIDGFLIGRASLDFQELEKIVHCNFST